MAPAVRPVPTAESLLASNACLNPLLGAARGSLRAFSTNAHARRDAPAAEDHDPFKEDYNAAIEDQHATRSRSKRSAARKGKGEATPSPRKTQAAQSTRLLRDLRSSSTPDTSATEAEAQAASLRLTTPMPHSLASAIADLERHLAAAAAVDWPALHRQGEEVRRASTMPGLSSEGGYLLRLIQQQPYREKVEEVERIQAESTEALARVRALVALMRAYYEQQQRGGGDAAGFGGGEKESGYSPALEEVRERKRELLRRKDEVAVRLARLRAKTQRSSGGWGSTPGEDGARYEDVAGTEGGSLKGAARTSHAARTSDERHVLAGSPSPHNDHNTRFDARDLRLHMPGNRLKIDDALTIDLAPHTPIKQLREQLHALQERLRAFHPPLDQLPPGIEPNGKGPTWKKAEMLRTWLKILVSRYQAKTGVVGQPVGDAKAMPGQELSEAAKQRMAKRWNARFAAKRGFFMDDGEPGQVSTNAQTRGYSTRAAAPTAKETTEPNDPHKEPSRLPHLTPSGSAHMVSISAKPSTPRTATAVGTVYFSNATPLALIASNALKKGDVLGVSRIAGIMAAKKCPDIVPLCHPILLTHVGVEVRTFGPGMSSSTASSTSSLASTTSSTTSSMSTPSPSPIPSSPDDMAHGGVQIECTVSCAGATGVEMEALTAVMGTALSVVDMCKAVDKFQRIGDVRVVLKEGGKSGVWREEGWRSWQG